MQIAEWWAEKEIEKEREVIHEGKIRERKIVNSWCDSFATILICSLSKRLVKFKSEYKWLSQTTKIHQHRFKFHIALQTCKLVKCKWIMQIKLNWRNSVCDMGDAELGIEWNSPRVWGGRGDFFFE